MITSMNALSFMVVFSLIAPSSSISCNGSNTFNIPSMLCSPKYKRLASSSASCHISCQSIATLISSFETSCACMSKHLVRHKKMKYRSYANQLTIRPDPPAHHYAAELCQPLLELQLYVNCLLIYMPQEVGT